MPFQHRSNNRILPANQRAVDVAKRALKDIIPIQQRRYDNAFQVQGYDCLVYNRLQQGLACSCQAHRKTLSTLLDADGKMKPGHINELLTGGLNFTVGQYGRRDPGRQDLRPNRGIDELSREDQVAGELTDENQLPFDVEGDLDDPYVKTADNQGLALDDVIETFDNDMLDTFTKCGVCFGTGFVGGYSVLGGWRKVIAAHSPEVAEVEGSIDMNMRPGKFYSTRVTMNVVLERGFQYLDALRLWDNTKMVQPTKFTLDGLPYSPDLFAALCDGRSHLLAFEFDDLTYWSHLEMQVGQSLTQAKLEFPRLTNGTNLTLKDLTEDVQINASPMIPKLITHDVLVESSFGKTFVVGSANLWNSRERNVLGWDVTARVIQSQELLSMLPRRRQLKQLSTNYTRDNKDGIRRT